MKTFRLCLEEDREIPQFKRLAWEMMEVPIEDVLLKGIHPWCGKDKDYSLVSEFAKRLNSDDAKVGPLESFGYSHDISEQLWFAQQGESRFELLLQRVRSQVYFVDALTFLDLLEIAKDRLRKRWWKRWAAAHEMTLFS